MQMDEKYQEKVEHRSRTSQVIRRSQVAFHLKDIVFVNRDASPGGHSYFTETPYCVIRFDMDAAGLIEQQERDSLAKRVAGEYVSALYDKAQVVDLNVEQSSVRFTSRTGFTLDFLVKATIEQPQNAKDDKDGSE